MPGIMRPVLGMFEDVEEMAFRHSGADFLLELRQPVRLTDCRQLLQMRRAVRVDAQFTVAGESCIDLGRCLRQFVLQRSGEVLSA